MFKTYREDTITYAVIGAGNDTRVGLSSEEIEAEVITPEIRAAKAILYTASAQAEFPNGIKYALLVTYDAARNPGNPSEVRTKINK